MSSLNSISPSAEEEIRMAFFEQFCQLLRHFNAEVELSNEESISHFLDAYSENERGSQDYLMQMLNNEDTSLLRLVIDFREAPYTNINVNLGY